MSSSYPITASEDGASSETKDLASVHLQGTVSVGGKGAHAPGLDGSPTLIFADNVLEYKEMNGTIHYLTPDSNTMAQTISQVWKSNRQDKQSLPEHLLCCIGPDTICDSVSGGWEEAVCKPCNTSKDGEQNEKSEEGKSCININNISGARNTRSTSVVLLSEPETVDARAELIEKVNEHLTGSGSVATEGICFHDNLGKLLLNDSNYSSAVEAQVPVMMTWKALGISKFPQDVYTGNEASLCCIWVL